MTLIDMPATDTTTTSPDPSQVLFGAMLRNRLTTLSERFDPVNHFEQQASLHKALKLSLRISDLHDLALEIYLQVFRVLIKRQPLPYWQDLLVDMLHVAKKKQLNYYVAHLHACKCQYLHEIDALELLYDECVLARSLPEVQIHPEAHFIILLSLAFVSYSKRNFDEAIQLIEERKNLIPHPSTLVEKQLYGRAFNSLGTIKAEQGSIKEAARYYNEAINYLQQTSDTFSLMLARTNFAYYFAQYEDGLDKTNVMIEGCDFFEHENYIIARNHTLLNLAHVYNLHNQLENAEDALVKMDVAYLYKIPATKLLAFHHNNLGHFYYQSKLLNLAEDQLLSAIYVYEQLGNQHSYSIANTKALLGTLYADQLRSKESNRVLLESLNLLQPLVQIDDKKSIYLYQEILEEFPHLKSET